MNTILNIATKIINASCGQVLLLQLKDKMSGFAISISSDSKNGFYASSDSKIILLLGLFLNVPINRLMSIVDCEIKQKELKEVLSRVEIWMEVALNTRVDFVLNKKHPVTINFKDMKFVLFQNGNANDKIIIQVYNFYCLVSECIANNENLVIVEDIG